MGGPILEPAMYSPYYMGPRKFIQIFGNFHIGPPEARERGFCKAPLVRSCQLRGSHGAGRIGYV